MSKVMIIDQKLNSVIIEVNPNILKSIGIKPEDIVKHKSRRQLLKDLDLFIKSLQLN